MQTISLPTEPTVIKKDKNEATIEIGSLYPGYGITLGNALRRILLSSLPGAAITSVKIEGANHEFTTFSGVKEDAIHVLLNLKQVRFRLYQEEPVVITIKEKGEREIKAEDFKTDSSIEIVNPDLLIATLTDKKATFEMEATISPGLGYQPVEKRKKEKLPIGRLALDAIYTPIRKANFRVENMRVGDKTDFNKLVFEIETDGSIEPELAFKKSVEILKEHIEVLDSLKVNEKKSKLSKSSSTKVTEDEKNKEE